MPRAPSAPSPNDARDVRLHVSLDLIVGLVALALIAAACSQPEPSDEYAEASRLFSEALAEKGEPAVFSDERVIRALELAEQVDRKSLDSEAARFLADRIRKGIEEATRRHAELQTTRSAVREGFAPSQGGGAAGAPIVAGDEDEEAGEPSPGLLRPGSHAREFTRRYAGCYQVKAPFVETGGTREGLAYGLADTEECREKHPELQGLLVYIADDRVFNIGPESTATPLDLVRDGDSLRPASAATAEPEEEEVPEIVLERFDEPEVPDIPEETVFVPGMPIE